MRKEIRPQQYPKTLLFSCLADANMKVSGLALRNLCKGLHAPFERRSGHSLKPPSPNPNALAGEAEFLPSFPSELPVFSRSRASIPVASAIAVMFFQRRRVLGTMSWNFCEPLGQGDCEKRHDRSVRRGWRVRCSLTVLLNSGEPTLPSVISLGAAKTP